MFFKLFFLLVESYVIWFLDLIYLISVQVCIHYNIITTIEFVLNFLCSYYYEYFDYFVFLFACSWILTKASSLSQQQQLSLSPCALIV